MLSYFVELIIYCAVSVLNWIISTLGSLVSGIISILPKSPFASFESSWFSGIKHIEYVQWIIPIDSIIALVSSFVIAVLGYYLLKWVLNWIKMVN